MVKIFRKYIFYKFLKNQPKAYFHIKLQTYDQFKQTYIENRKTNQTLKHAFRLQFQLGFNNISQANKTDKNETG